MKIKNCKIENNNMLTMAGVRKSTLRIALQVAFKSMIVVSLVNLTTDPEKKQKLYFSTLFFSIIFDFLPC